MIINGKELKFNILKKSDAANYKRAIEEMKEKEREIQQQDTEDLCTVLERIEDLFRGFFITTTGVNVIGDCDDVGEMSEMYDEFLKEVAKQQKNLKIPSIPKGKK